MRRCRSLALGVVVWLVAALPAVAQRTAEVEPGQLVRVSVDCGASTSLSANDARQECPEGGRETGTLIALDSSRLVLETDGTSVSHPLGSVTMLEASRGSGSRWKAGTLIGFAGGTAVTFAILNSGSPGSTNACDPTHNQDAIGGAGTCLAVAGVIGGLSGAFVGLVVGSLLHTERWEEVSLDGLRVALYPQGPRPGLGVSVSLPLFTPRSHPLQ